MTDKLLMKFAKKGINLTPEAYELIINSDNPTNFASSVIIKLKSKDFKSKDLIAVNADTIRNLNKEIGSALPKKEKTAPGKVETKKEVKTTPKKEAEKPKIQKEPEKEIIL